MAKAELSADQARDRLYAIMREDCPFREKAEQALRLGVSYLEVENGHLTRIDEETDFWETIASTDGPDGDFPPGLILDLETTYCRRTIAEDPPIDLHNAPEQGWADDPAFETHDLHCYHGTTLTVDDEVYGTVCFVSKNPRDAPFSDGETMFAELISRLLEHELEYSRQQAELDRRETLVNVLGRVLRHNLRNDMSVIRGRVRMLAEGAQTGEPHAEAAIETINELFELSETAREFESIDRAELERQPIELMTLIEEVAAAARADHPEAPVTVEGPDELTVAALPSLATSLEELTENAIKHSGMDPVVEISVEAGSEDIKIQVRDNGPGLPEQEQKVLSAGRETPLVHGSGLGLWLVHWIIADQGGSLGCDVDDDGTAISITLPRQAENYGGATDQDTQLALQRARDQFQAVFDESFDAMVIADEEGRNLEANPAAVELFGTPYEELLGRRIADFAPDEFDSERAWAQFHDEGTQRGEFTLVRPDGTERVVEFSATSDIVPGQHLSILRDVTERKERERRYDAVFNNTYQFTGLLDPEGTLLEANETALEFGGVNREEVIGEKLWETEWFHYSEETRRKARDAVERAATGEFVRFELPVQGDERDAVIDFSVRPITDDDGTVTMLVPEGRDITELDDVPSAALPERAV